MFMYIKRYIHKCINPNIYNADNHAYVNKICNDIHKNPNTSHQALRICFNHIGVHFDCYEKNGQLGKYCHVSICDYENLSMHWWCLYEGMFTFEAVLFACSILAIKWKESHSNVFTYASEFKFMFKHFYSANRVKNRILDKAYLVYSYLLKCLDHCDPLSPLMSFTLPCVYSYALFKYIHISVYESTCRHVLTLASMPPPLHS
jgi:hypothetical protein